MNNDTSPSTRRLVTRQAGSLSLALWHDGAAPDEHGGYRQLYAYRIADATVPGSVPHDGRDIHSGVGADVDVVTGMGTLVTFLSAAADAYRYQMSNPVSAPENLNLFPAWVVEAAYLNSDELAMLALELEHPNGPAVVEPATVEAPPIASPVQEVADDGPAWPPGRYYTVVFLQDEEGHAVVDLLDEHGVEAAIEHLAQWDFGSETLEAALFNEDYHAEVPTYQGTREARSDSYVLSYQPGLGTVHLLRELPTESPAGWPDRYTGFRNPAANALAERPPQTAASERAGRHAPHSEPPQTRPDDGLSL
ncbi:hypothetical protein [Promicromonospora iranensis]|uniref:Uncharacterized protein n=1 Tax=Promicromonospora iranensis TaxID=1105144 RepID=A0ABU2CIV5_9MICO|nr:hypothetical protein [Promicromonospora iranensis]MDR7381247.1 hypothetical protein [Promicromonospora iranensis]